MKILEELKREQAAENLVSVGRERRARPRSPASGAVQHAMKYLRSELIEFAEGLNQLATDVRVDYDVHYMGALKGLVQSGYSVVSDPGDVPRFEFCFRCTGAHALSKVVNTIAEREQLQAELKRLDLVHKVDHMTTWRYAVSVKPEVNVRLRFTPAASGSYIRLEARNLHRLGSELFSIQPTKVNEALLDELGKMVLRRENRFAEMSGNSVSDEMRRKLRERVEARQHRQAALADQVHKEMAAEHARRKRALHAAQAASQRARAGHAPRTAPVMVAESAPTEGWVDWDGSGAAALDTGRVKPKPAPVSTPMAGPDGAPEAGRGNGSNRYAWLITRDVKCEDTAGTIAKRGPAGSQRAFPIPVIMNTGQPFRLKTRDGDVRFLGSIAGEYQGVEPLVDFGLRHGCYVIEYQRGGEWVQVRAGD